MSAESGVLHAAVLLKANIASQQGAGELLIV